MNVYDQAARFAVKLDPEGFLRWLLAGMDADLRFRGWLDTQTIPFPGEPDRRCDTVAGLEHASGLAPPWAVVLESQTRPESFFTDRLLEYLVRLRRELRHGPHGRDRYQVGAALVQLTGAAPPVSLEMVLPGNSGVGLRWRAGVRAVAEEDGAAFLAAIEAGHVARSLLPWTPLMRAGGEAATLAEWIRLGAVEPDRRRRAEYAGLAVTFADLAGWGTFWRQSLEGWNVEESVFIQEMMAKGQERGLELGRQKLRGTLVRAWRSRFGHEMPSDVLAAVQAQKDLDDLSRWVDAAVAAASAEELRRAILG